MTNLLRLTFCSLPLLSIIVGCSGKSKQDDKTTTTTTSATATAASGADANRAAAPKAAPPAKPKVVACDQRAFVSPFAKSVAKPGKEPEPNRLCMDYSNRKGGFGSASCVEGTALETPCPDEDVIATCTLESTGVVYKTYKGASAALAEKSCKSLEGTFAKK